MSEVGLLREMLGIYSPSCDEREMAELIVRFALEHGLAAHIDDAGNAVVEAGDGGQELLLLGHMDTVEGMIPVREQGGLLYGRGAVDAKGPLACFLCALARVKGKLQGKRVVVVGAVEEEHHTSKGARHVCESHNPEMIIIGEPSGLDALTLGYKGCLQVRLSQRSSASHGAGREESASDRALAFHAEARAYVQGFNAGKGEMERLTLRVKGLDRQQTPFEERISLTLGFRLPLGFDPAHLKERLSALACGGELEFFAEEMPYAAGKSNRLVSAFLRALRSEGLEPRFTMKNGTSDMNVVGPRFKVPIVAYGPGDPSLDHTPDEHVRIEDYLRAIDVMEKVLLGL